MFPLPTRRNFHVGVTTLCRVINCVMQGYTNPRRHVAVATTFCAATPNICVPSVKSMLHVSSFWRVEFWGGSWIFGKSVHPRRWHRVVWQVGSLHHVVWKARQPQPSLFRTQHAICTLPWRCQCQLSTGLPAACRLMTFTVLAHPYSKSLSSNLARSSPFLHYPTTVVGIPHSTAVGPSLWPSS
jgi:hypothetical protein